MKQYKGFLVSSNSELGQTGEVDVVTPNSTVGTLNFYLWVASLTHWKAAFFFMSFHNGVVMEEKLGWSASLIWSCLGMNGLLLLIVVVLLVAVLGSSQLLVPDHFERKLSQRSWFLACWKLTWVGLKWFHNQQGIVGFDTIQGRFLLGCVWRLIYRHRCFIDVYQCLFYLFVEYPLCGVDAKGETLQLAQFPMSIEHSDRSRTGIEFKLHVAVAHIQLGEVHLIIELVLQLSECWYDVSGATYDYV